MQIHQKLLTNNESKTNIYVRFIMEDNNGNIVFIHENEENNEILLLNGHSDALITKPNIVPLTHAYPCLKNVESILNNKKRIAFLKDGSALYSGKYIYYIDNINDPDCIPFKIYEPKTDIISMEEPYLIDTKENVYILNSEILKKFNPKTRSLEAIVKFLVEFPLSKLPLLDRYDRLWIVDKLNTIIRYDLNSKKAIKFTLN